jgi:hypothetical protein
MREGHNTSPWRSFFGLLLVVALSAGAWIVLSHLRRSAALQECFASGRTNCLPIDGTTTR